MPRSRRQQPGGDPGVSVPVPAPGELETVQAFVNTAPVDGGADALAGPADLGRWLSRRGLLPAGTEISEQGLRRAQEVRGGLHAVLAAKTRGELDAEAAERLEKAAAEARCRLRFDDGGPVGLDPASANLDDALGAILAAFAVGRAGTAWPYFGLCARRGCHRAFYDASRSRTGRWCTSRCGNRARAATYRRRDKHRR